MTKCTDKASIYEDIEFCRGKKSLPGLRNWVLGIPKRDVVTYPTIKADAENIGAVGVYEGDFVLAGDKKWHKVGTIPNEDQLQTESQGTYGSKTFKVTLNFSIPGTEEEATGYINEMNNDEMLFLVPQRNGKYRLVGSESFTPELSLKQDSGKATTDTNATTVEAVVDDEYSAPFYPGKIETTDGDISGATGKPIVSE